MALSRNKIINILIIAGAIFISSFLSLKMYEWMVSIDANLTLRIAIPLVVFLTSIFGFWIMYNFFKIFLFQQRGIKGYQLRGKISFYFLIVSIASIVIVGGLMFYLIFLIENSFIKEEKSIAETVMEDYRNLINENKLKFEENIIKQVITTPSEFPIVFYFSNNRIFFERGETNIISEEILSSQNKIFSYFSKNPEPVFYFGDKQNTFIVNNNNKYYAVEVPKQLSRSFKILKENIENFYRVNLLKRYIRPISIVSLIVFSVPILVGVFFISLSLAKSITSNIEKIVKGTKVISEGNFSYRVRIKSNDEIQDLAKNFNKMAYRLKLANEQIKRMERLEAWQEMAKRLAHEIKNPLTPIKLSAERLLYAFEYKQDDFPAILEKTTSTVIGEVKRLESLVNEFSKFARLPNLKLSRRNIIETLNEIVKFFTTAYPELKFITEFNGIDELIIDYDNNQLKQVIINIITNSIEACENSEKYVKMITTIENDLFKIAVEDKSGGIPIELRDKIFEPYFTTKTEGTGLGLAIAERIILEHNGNIWFETDIGSTTFYIELLINKDEA